MEISYRIDGELFLTPSGISGPDRQDFGVTVISAETRNREFMALQPTLNYLFSSNYRQMPISQPHRDRSPGQACSTETRSQKSRTEVWTGQAGSELLIPCAASCENFGVFSAMNAVLPENKVTSKMALIASGYCVASSLAPRRAVQAQSI